MRVITFWLTSDTIHIIHSMFILPEVVLEVSLRKFFSALVAFAWWNSLKLGRFEEGGIAIGCTIKKKNERIGKIIREKLSETLNAMNHLAFVQEWKLSERTRSIRILDVWYIEEVQSAPFFYFHWVCKFKLVKVMFKIDLSNLFWKPWF